MKIILQNTATFHFITAIGAIKRIITSYPIRTLIANPVYQNGENKYTIKQMKKRVKSIKGMNLTKLTHRCQKY